MNETENSFYSDLWDDETAKIYSEAAFEEGESEVLSSSNFISNAKQFGHTHVTSRLTVVHPNSWAPNQDWVNFSDRARIDRLIQKHTNISKYKTR